MYELVPSMNLVTYEQSGNTKALAQEAQSVETEEQARIVIKKFNKIYTTS
jgi:hypothetical protein